MILHEDGQQLWAHFNVSLTLSLSALFWILHRIFGCLSLNLIIILTKSDTCWTKSVHSAFLFHCVHISLHWRLTWICPHYFTRQVHMDMSEPFYTTGWHEWVHTSLHCRLTWICLNHFTLQVHMDMSTPFYTAGAHGYFHTILHCRLTWMCPHHLTLQTLGYVHTILHRRCTLICPHHFTL